MSSQYSRASMLTLRWSIPSWQMSACKQSYMWLLVDIEEVQKQGTHLLTLCWSMHSWQMSACTNKGQTCRVISHGWMFRLISWERKRSETSMLTLPWPIQPVPTLSTPQGRRCLHIARPLFPRPLHLWDKDVRTAHLSPLRPLSDRQMLPFPPHLHTLRKKMSAHCMQG